MTDKPGFAQQCKIAVCGLFRRSSIKSKSSTNAAALEHPDQDMHFHFRSSTETKQQHEIVKDRKKGKKKKPEPELQTRVQTVGCYTFPKYNPAKGLRKGKAVALPEIREVPKRRKRLPPPPPPSRSVSGVLPRTISMPSIMEEEEEDGSIGGRRGIGLGGRANSVATMREMGGRRGDGNSSGHQRRGNGARNRDCEEQKPRIPEKSRARRVSQLPEIPVVRSEDFVLIR